MEDRFYALAEALPALVFITNAAGENIYTNLPFQTYTGLGARDLLGDGWLRALHTGDRERAHTVWSEAVRHRGTYEAEYRFRRYDGSYRWFLVRGLPVLGSDGQVADWFGTCTDIHNHKQAEETLRQANDDLRQLVWAASHDLQEPVRIIMTLAQFLQRREADRLSLEGQQLIQALLSGAGRMQTLLDSLRIYWRASEEGVQQAECVRVEDALREALVPLQDAAVKTNTQIVQEPLPTLWTDRAALVEVVRQLIGNAIQYRLPDRPLRIEFSVRREADYWFFAVADNGPGIAAEYREQVFTLFKRLHRHDEIAGAGMGLSLCRRLVEQQGGRIWVEPASGGGAAFCFTLPVVEGGPSTVEANTYSAG